MMKSTLVSIFVCLFWICSPLWAGQKKVAIFDFDDRLHLEKSVAKYLEKQLAKVDESLIIEQYSGEGNIKKSHDTLHKLDKQGYDLIITITSDALIIAQHAVKETPVLFTNANNPMFLGIKDLDAPGGNMSGASYYVAVQKQIELFKHIQPKIKKLGFIFDEKNKSTLVEFKESRFVCKRSAGLEFVSEMVRSKSELKRAAERLLEKNVDALVLTTSDTIYNNVKMIKALTDPAKIPIYSFHKKAVENGAIASLSSDYYLMAEKIIIPMARKVLYENMSPGDMPVGFLEENTVSLNLSAAKAIGLEVPEDVSLKAEIIY